MIRQYQSFGIRSLEDTESLWKATLPKGWHLGFWGNVLFAGWKLGESLWSFWFVLITKLIEIQSEIFSFSSLTKLDYWSSSMVCATSTRPCWKDPVLQAWCTCIWVHVAGQHMIFTVYSNSRDQHKKLGKKCGRLGGWLWGMQPKHCFNTTYRCYKSFQPAIRRTPTNRGMANPNFGIYDHGKYVNMCKLCVDMAFGTWSCPLKIMATVWHMVHM